MKKIKKGIALLLVAVMILPLGTFAFGEKTDTSNHWAKEEIQYLMGKGLVSGYSNGDFKPEQSITRAEFIKIVNSVFGYSKVGEVKFEDVGKNDWFHDEIGKAVEAGYIGGYGDNTIKPNSPITRQEASKIMGMVFDLDENKSKSANSFIDGVQIGDWAKGYVSILKDKGYISGYLDKTFKPTNLIKRAEAVKMISNTSGNIINLPGEYKEDADGNVLVNTSKVVLKDMTIKGDLYLAEGIKEGDVTLDTVIVKGKTYIRGGGENSIIIRNSKLGELVVKKENNNVRVVIDENSNLSDILINEYTILVIKKGAKVESIKVTGKAKIEVEKGAQVGSIEIEAKGVEIKSEGTIDSVVSTEDVKINDKVFVKGKDIGLEYKTTKPSSSGGSSGGSGVSKVVVSAITVTVKGNVRKISTDKGTLQMLADVKPTAATNKNIKWSVTNEDGSATDKATINTSGLLTAVKNGKVKVRATSVSTPAVSDELVIEISDQLLPSTIVFAEEGPIAKIVEDKPFTNKVTGGDGDGAITYTSETPATATVNKTTGEVTIVAVGSTVITASKAATKTHGEIKNTYTINVTINSVKPSTIVFAEEGPIAKIVGDKPFTNKVTGGDGDGAITYTSETPATATVNKTTGEVTIVAVGSTVITASKAATKTHGEVKNTYTVNINNKPKVLITKVAVFGVPEVGVELTAELTPKDATATYQWKRMVTTPKVIIEDIPGATTNKYIPTDDDIGFALVPEATGTGDYSGRVVTNTARVKEALRLPSSIIFADSGPIPKKVGDFSFTNKVTGGVGSGAITYTSENPAVATVNKTTGLVTIVAPGSTVISATKEGTATHRAVINTYKINVAEVVIIKPDFAGGSGRLSDPYMVSNAQELYNVRKQPHSYFIQTANIDLGVAPWNKEMGWEPIGNFQGNYNGQGYKISGLTINSKEEYQGLFGVVYNEASISNLGLVDVKINGGARVGSIAGMNYGAVDNCYATGSVEGDKSVGGLVGTGASMGGGASKSFIKRSYSTARVKGTDYVGGILGHIVDGKVEKCYATGPVVGEDDVGGLVGSIQLGDVNSCYATGKVTGDERVGGLVGHKRDPGNIEDSHAKGSVTGNKEVGGLVGRFTDVGKIRNCYATGSVIGNAYQSVGGLVGGCLSDTTIEYCYATGSVTSVGYNVGGLVGHANGSIDNSYATGSVTGFNRVGGLVGSSYIHIKINYCYATGLVKENNTIGKTYVAGIIGYNSGEVKNCYYDKETTGRDDKGKGNPKTTKEMTTQSTFTNFSFGTWSIETSPASYPYLRWQGTENIPRP